MQQNTRIGRSDNVVRARPSSTGHARSVLRTRTLDLHIHAEDVLGADSCGTLAGYGGMLRSNLAVTEAVLRATALLLPQDMRQGLAVDALRLRRDLAAIGARPDREDAHLELGEAAGAMGAVYVLEGARLGGKLLARRVETQLGLAAEHGATYLNGDGPDAGRRWRRFLAALETRVVSSEEIAQAVAAARETFRLVIRHYEKIPR